MEPGCEYDNGFLNRFVDHEVVPFRPLEVIRGMKRGLVLSEGLGKSGAPQRAQEMLGLPPLVPGMMGEEEWEERVSCSADAATGSIVSCPV
jgi:hypothetical protein